MFLRFGFVIGQMGILGLLLLLVISYLINILTTLSVSAIATNGTVRGGGAYYMISRSLGPEFGGAIGIIFCAGQTFNASLNVLGFIEPLLTNFGSESGVLKTWLNELPRAAFGYSSALLAICTAIAATGSKLVSKTGFCLFVILSLSTLSIPFSILVVRPFIYDNIKYTGPSWLTLTDNLWPRLSAGAAGSAQPAGVPETFRNIFGIFFPATAGILAGASMSGELKTPSKLIPSGTLYGLLVSFIFYSLVILSMGVAIPRKLLHFDINVIQTVNMHPLLIIAGELSTALFSVIMGIVGAATMLTAIANDQIVPGLGPFLTLKKSPAAVARAQLLAIAATWVLAQVLLLANVNQIANLITMAFLMTFIVTNMACFLLRISLAPNFRPLFKYFSSKTALAGVVCGIGAMFIVDGIAAIIAIAQLLLLIVVIHYMTPPSNFGDISQVLIYHQVRKYLLRLKTDVSVKSWRPQILLLCDDPKTLCNLIGFCNHLKKGGLYVLGHVIVANEELEPEKGEFTSKVFHEIRRQKQAWTLLRDMLHIKAFVHISIGPTLPWGVRNVYLGSGLGGMRPNITVLGFYDFAKARGNAQTVTVSPPPGPGRNREQRDGGPAAKIGINGNPFHSHMMDLPTDTLRKERKVSVAQWVQIVEDLVILQATVAVAANFARFSPPMTKSRSSWSWFNSQHTARPLDGPQKKFIDLYPIQMSSFSTLADGQSVLSTNFDTYTLILQLGAILKTVSEWKLGYVLRVIAFVETEGEVEEERARLDKLLTSLRFEASILVICLETQDLVSYNYIVKGHRKLVQHQAQFAHMDTWLNPCQWWQNLCNARESLAELDNQRRRNQKASGGVRVVKPECVTRDFAPLNLSGTSPAVPINTSLLNRRYTLLNLHEQGLSLLLNMSTAVSGAFMGQTRPLESGEESGMESSVMSSDEDASEAESPGQYRDVAPQRAAVAAKGSKPKPNVMPNFLSVKIPDSHVNSEDEEDVDGDENERNIDRNAQGAIRFLPEETESEAGDESGILHKLAQDSGESLAANSKPKKSRSAIIKASHSRTSRSPSRAPSIFSNDEEVIQQLKTPTLLADSSRAHISSKPSHLSLSRDQHYTSANSQPPDSPRITRKQLQQEVDELTFNDIPARGQHLILNELMRSLSPAGQTLIIFSTLPAPPLGTHLDEDELMEYTQNIALWIDQLGPVMLVNSQTVTVTTAL